MQDHAVQLVAVSETSLNFKWNEYKHCNNDSIFVEYEYELLQDSDSTLIYGGKETNTFVSFDDLESGTAYSLRVRVHVISSSTDTSFSSWSLTHEMTLKAPGMSHSFRFPLLSLNT